MLVLGEGYDLPDPVVFRGVRDWALNQATKAERRLKSAVTRSKEVPGAWIDTTSPSKKPKPNNANNSLKKIIRDYRTKELEKELEGVGSSYPTVVHRKPLGDPRSKVPCYWYNEGPHGCHQGSKCPFLHVKSSQTVKPSQDDFAASLTADAKKTIEEEKK